MKLIRLTGTRLITGLGIKKSILDRLREFLRSKDEKRYTSLQKTPSTNS